MHYEHTVVAIWKNSGGSRGLRNVTRFELELRLYESHRSDLASIMVEADELRKMICLRDIPREFSGQCAD